MGRHKRVARAREDVLQTITRVVQPIFEFKRRALRQGGVKIMNLLSRLFGGGGSSHDKVISNDLKRLNQLKAGLGDQAINYVRTGADATVLSSLSVLCKGNEIEVCKTYLNHGSPTRPRWELFARGQPYDLELMQRYAEVVSAVASATTVKTVGTDAAPMAVRVFF